MKGQLTAGGTNRASASSFRRSAASWGQLTIFIALHQSGRTRSGYGNTTSHWEKAPWLTGLPTGKLEERKSSCGSLYLLHINVVCTTMIFAKAYSSHVVKLYLRAVSLLFITSIAHHR